jgi:hypothetical protein
MLKALFQRHRLLALAAKIEFALHRFVKSWSRQ